MKIINMNEVSHFLIHRHFECQLVLHEVCYYFNLSSCDSDPITEFECIWLLYDFNNSILSARTRNTEYSIP